mmetsp:Transcript_3019/g.6552  ORF Transcript_3019/g.6552 Transcript_3019/m.6552 type:complete len:99 (+) Transcript_3019:91-387(+)
MQLPGQPTGDLTTYTTGAKIVMSIGVSLMACAHHPLATTYQSDYLTATVSVFVSHMLLLLLTRRGALNGIHTHACMRLTAVPICFCGGTLLLQAMCDA